MKRNVVIGAIILLLAGGLGTLYYLNTVRHRGEVAVIVRVSPSDADVTVDGQDYPAGKKVYVKPGRHDFKATRQHFEAVSTSLELDEQDANREIVLILAANSNEAKAFLRDRPSEQTLREALGGQLTNEQGAAARDKTPLVELLPFIDREYRIDYGPSQKNPTDPTAIAITITSTSETTKQDALAWIRFKGYDPAELEIIYKNF